MTADPNSRPSWGLLPADVVQSLNVKYWQNRRKRKSLLSGDIAFPLVVSLQPPTGKKALAKIHHFQKFVTSWRAFVKDSGAKGWEVRWESRTWRSLAEQKIPTHLSLSDIGALAGLLGTNEARQLRAWQSKITYLFNALCAAFNQRMHQSSQVICDQKLFLALIPHLETLERLDAADLELLVKLIPQLQQGMGEGCYLRALPVTWVDTKFIEQNQPIIEALTAALIDGAVTEIGLLTWLDCRAKPKHWLLIKPLCEQTAKSLGGMPLLRLSSDTLLEFELPANNILVIENEQSCLALGHVPNTIAAAGGGKDVAWLQAEWLAEKHVGYWGDIDSEGFSILSEARSKLSSIMPMMMDIATVETYTERMVAEPDSVSKDPIALTDEELELFKRLRSGHYANARLEQERLPMEYVMQNIVSWIVKAISK